MKVGMLSRYPPLEDGIAIYTENLVRGFDKKIEVKKIGQPRGNVESPMDLKGFSLARRLSEAAKDVDVLHIQYVAAFYSKLMNANLLQWRRRRGDTRYIITLHEVQKGNQGLREAALHAIQAALVRRADAVVVHTVEQMGYLRSVWGPEKIHHIPMGAEKRVPVGRPDPSKLLLFGMISKKKGYHDLLEAMPGLGGMRLTIAGRPLDTTTERDLRQRAGKARLRLGWIDEKEKDRLFRDTGIVVLPYRWAPYQSAVMMDAIAFGLPIVATDVGNHADIVARHGLGTVAKAGDPASLAEAIVRVRERYEEYCKKVRAYAKKVWWSGIAKQHEHLYRGLVKAVH